MPKRPKQPVNTPTPTTRKNRARVGGAPVGDFAKNAETKCRNNAETLTEFGHTAPLAPAVSFASARHIAPLATARFFRQADQAIQLSKIDTTSRLPLGARLESTRPR